jgi:hypothetical protein
MRDQEMCDQEGYRADAYGLGLDAGFNSSLDLRPALNDEGCYRLGVQEGRRLGLAAALSASADGKGTVGSHCAEHFARGHDDGFNLVTGNLLDRERSACYYAGYRSGRALMNTGARQLAKGTVGKSCVDFYQRGKGDAKSDNDARLPNRNIEVHTRDEGCYRTGYVDGRMFEF